MNVHYYVLDERGEPKAAANILMWGAWLERADPHRVVARERIGASTVSTVFLGLNHGFGGGPPILWETMVFGGTLDQEQDRCAGSREQAQAMHAAVVARVREASVTIDNKPKA